MPRTVIHHCRSCTYVLDSYEVDDDGKCITCEDTKTETIAQCDGCEATDVDLDLYVVDFHDGGSAHVAYCTDCRDLAKMDWNGETKSIVEVPCQG